MTGYNAVAEAVEEDNVTKLMEAARSLSAKDFTSQLIDAMEKSEDGIIAFLSECGEIDLSTIIKKLLYTEVIVIRITPQVVKRITYFTVDIELFAGQLQLDNQHSISTTEMAGNCLENMLRPLGSSKFARKVLFNQARLFCNAIKSMIGPYDCGLKILYDRVNQNNPEELQDWGSQTVAGVVLQEFDDKSA